MSQDHLERQYQPAKQGATLLESGRFVEAATIFEQILATSPTDLDALLGLSEACFALDDKPGARHYIDLALKVNPDDPRSLNNAGVLLFHDKRYENAADFLARAVHVAPDFVDAHFNICSALGRLTLANQESFIKPDCLLQSLHWISDHAADSERQELLALNVTLRNELLDRFRNAYDHLGLRILLHSPTSNMGALYYIFESWQQCLSFMGVETKLILAGYPIDEILESFDPNVLISVDVPEVSGTINWTNLYNHLNRHRVLIGICSDFRTLPREADFYVTFHLDPKRCERLRRVESPLLSLPFAFNPLLHRMVPAQQLFDFAFVGTNSPVKEKETLDYLVPIVRQYSGILAGTGWPGRFANFSQGDASFLYNFAKICPNYHLQAQVDNYSEINERTHALQACGAFQICDRPKAAKDLYEVDELITAGSPSEFSSLFAHFLEQPRERSDIVRRGMTRAWNTHSQFHVLQQLIDFGAKRI